MSRKYELFSNGIERISRDIQRLERMEMARYGLKGPHAQCLLALSRYPEGLIATQLCELCEKDKAAISRIVTELEEGGLVQRVEHNGTRYRATLVLTASGREAAEGVSRAAKWAVERASEGLSESDRELFYRMLTQIADNLQNICKEGLLSE